MSKAYIKESTRKAHEIRITLYQVESAGTVTLRIHTNVEEGIADDTYHDLLLGLGESLTVVIED